MSVSQTTSLQPGGLEGEGLRVAGGGRFPQLSLTITVLTNDYHIQSSIMHHTRGVWLVGW